MPRLSVPGHRSPAAIAKPARDPWPQQLLSWRPLEPDRPATEAVARGANLHGGPDRRHLAGLVRGSWPWGRLDLGRHPTEGEARRACEQDAQRHCRQDEERPIDIRIAPGKRRGR